MSLAYREVMLVAAEAGLDIRTVKRVLGDAHRPTLAVRACLCNALVGRGHSKLAAALERDGRLHATQRDDTWPEGPGRPSGKATRPYAKRGTKKLASNQHNGR